MTVRPVVLVVSIGWFGFLFGQDTIPLPKAAFRIFFNFDFRSTFVNADPVRFYGFRLGAQRNLDMISIGFYGLGDPYVQPSVDLAGIGKRELRTDFDYTALTYERLLINSKRWQVGVPVSIGLGNYRKSYLNEEQKLVPYSTNELVPLEASLHADYNLFWWIFIGVGGGYRHVLAADLDATKTLSDWTYYGKVGLRLGEVVKRVRTKIKKNGAQGS
mgnify:CR=1 FL=1